MADILAHHEDGHLDVELDLAHLKGARVLMGEQITEKLLIRFLALPLALVRDPGRLQDAGVGAHVIEVADETVIVDVNSVTFFHISCFRVCWVTSVIG